MFFACDGVQRAMVADWPVVEAERVQSTVRVAITDEYARLVPLTDICTSVTYRRIDFRRAQILVPYRLRDVVGPEG